MLFRILVLAAVVLFLVRVVRLLGAQAGRRAPGGSAGPAAREAGSGSGRQRRRRGFSFGERDVIDVSYRAVEGEGESEAGGEVAAEGDAEAARDGGKREEAESRS